MPPRKDVSSSDETSPPIAEQLSLLIEATTAASANSTETANNLADLIRATQTLTTKIDQLTDHVTAGDDSPPRHRSPLRRPQNQNRRQPRQPKITLPLFDGSNSLEWIFQAENFFSYYQTPEDERVELAVFHFVGDALSWYKHQADNELLGTWNEFKREMEIRFGPSSYENHEATLFKLKQSSTVAAYQTEFEKISNRVVGIPRQALKNCFISGLRLDIQHELAIYKPATLHHAYGLARLIEDKLAHAYKTRSTFFNKPATNIASSSSNPSSMASSSSNPLPPLLPTPSKPPALPFTKLSPEALMQRRKDGLCFKCPEKYFPGHKCSPPQFFLIVDNEDQAEFTEPPHETTPPDSPKPSLLCLSDAAYFGIASPQTLRVTGYIMGKRVTILIDCGSTHNIIQPRIALMLRLETLPIQPFDVMVGNGEHITCKGYCPEVPIQVQKAPFHVPFFILPVEGADVILGIGWLGMLGRLSADFSIPEISFVKDGNTYTLKGEPLAHQVSSSSLQSLIKKGSVASLHTINHQSPQLYPPATITHVDPQITTLLTEFHTIFDEPNSLPPNRSQDHHITLTDETKPITVRPYRYPHFQKRIMTNLISEMLQSGVIRPSQSPFSSPVLLVKKKTARGVFVSTIAP
ncbi:uncharacterized protein LOC118482726 [Helianthus annuus]|uniref:uncharacterized protein LOC118482726 n=1 Tax=Helianthus annuus TaxID=4232 RepID=UPI001653320B|nr:uncharacterized protein LOC118482726 [Helianthus annuus]